MATVLLHPDVEEKLESYQNDLEGRIREKLEDAGRNPGHYLKPLSGRSEYRLRVGDYRAIIEWDKQRDELRVLELDKRDRIYD